MNHWMLLQYILTEVVFFFPIKKVNLDNVIGILRSHLSFKTNTKLINLLKVIIVSHNSDNDPSTQCYFFLKQLFITLCTILYTRKGCCSLTMLGLYRVPTSLNFWWAKHRQLIFFKEGGRHHVEFHSGWYLTSTFTGSRIKLAHKYNSRIIAAYL